MHNVVDRGVAYYLGPWAAAGFSM